MKITPKDIADGLDMSIGIVIAVAAFISLTLLMYTIIKFLINIFYYGW